MRRSIRARSCSASGSISRRILGSTLRRSRTGATHASPLLFSFPVAIWIFGTIIAATLERWWFPRAWDETGLPASRFYFGDTRAFLDYAAALSAGERFDNGVPFHPPGWPLFLSMVFQVFGWSDDAPPDPLVIKHIAAGLSGISVGLAALLAHILSGRSAMMITSLLGIFHFGHMVQAAAPNSEPLYGLLIILVLLGAVRQRTPGWLLGVLAGFATLVRAEFILCASLLALWLAFGQSGARPVRRAAYFTLGFVLALLPTTILNWRSIGEFNDTRADRMPGALSRFAPVTGYGAFSFANANHERADGGFNWDLPSLEPSDEEAERLLEGGALDLSRPPVYRAYVDGYSMGAAWLVSNPAAAISLFAKKLAITLSVFDYGYLLDNVPSRIRGTRRPVDQIDLETSWVTVAHMMLVVGGVWIAATNPSAKVLLFPVVTLLAASLLFFGYVRLGVAYLPVLWILQALAVTRVLAVIPLGPRARRRMEFAVAGLVVVLLLTERYAAGRPRALMIDGLVDESERLVEDQKIEIVRVR
jgi:hypothetical protein